VAGEGALEARATQPQPRVDRVEFLAERFGDLRHAETFDLGRHGHFARLAASRTENDALSSMLCASIRNSFVNHL
jgi:hypothetical protein